jgi:DNA-binding transcriptional regulator YhcF (GntR family)
MKNNNNRRKYRYPKNTDKSSIRLKKNCRKNYKKGDKLPSINKVCLEFKISRDTVMLAYDELKKEESFMQF